MAVMDFPTNPTNGQQTTDGRYYFDSSVGSTGAWRSTPLPVGGLPAGSIMAWGTNTPPANWLLADGSAVSRSVYSSLFAVIGTQYGTGDGSTTFNLPDLRGRVPVGRNDGTFSTLGATGGAERHTLTIAEMPSHSHTKTTSTAGSSTTRVAIGSATTTNDAFTTDPAGGGQSHNNLQPYQVVNYIIKFSAGWTAGDSELATRVGAVEAVNTTQNTRLTSLEAYDAAVDSSWTAYTPTLYNATIGNGVVSFYYKKIGKTVFVRGKFVLGSTSNIGTLFDWSLPFSVNSTYAFAHCFGMSSYQVGGLLWNGTNVWIGGNTIRGICWMVGGSYIRNQEVTPTTPATWVSGNVVALELSYEAA